MRQMTSLADALVRHLDAEGEEPPYDFTGLVDAWLTDSASPEVDTLASVYATMIFHRLKVIRLDEVDDKAKQLLGAWRARRA